MHVLPSGYDYTGRKAAFKAVFQGSEHAAESKVGHRHSRDRRLGGHAVGWRGRLAAEQRSERRAQILQELRTRSLAQLWRIAELHGGGQDESEASASGGLHEHQDADRGAGRTGTEREAVGELGQNSTVGLFGADGETELDRRSADPQGGQEEQEEKDSEEDAPRKAGGGAPGQLRIRRSAPEEQGSVVGEAKEKEQTSVERRRLSRG